MKHGGMGRHALVTIGSDGLSDYVQLSDGQRYMLGSVSILRFVTELAPGSLVARSTLDDFLAGRRTMLRVDLDRMWQVLAPRRARHSSVVAIPLIPPAISRSLDLRTLRARQGTMADTSDRATQEAIANQITRIEGQIALLEQKAKDAGGTPAASMKSDIDSLKSLITELRRPSPYGDQSKNETFYGLPGAKQASFDMLQANTSLAEEILTKVASTNDKIEQLVLAGKRFDSPRAKQDLHKIASRVSEIVQNVDLAQPWVRQDLAVLAKSADAIHSLFA